YQTPYNAAWRGIAKHAAISSFDLGSSRPKALLAYCDNEPEPSSLIRLRKASLRGPGKTRRSLSYCPATLTESLESFGSTIGQATDQTCKNRPKASKPFNCPVPAGSLTY